MPVRKEAVADLRDAIMSKVEAAGGIVMVDGERMVKRGVLRDVMTAFIDDLMQDVRERLIVVVGPGGEERMAAELDDIEARISQHVAEMFPVVNN